MQKLSPEEFPPLLKQINDPPKHLYARGTLPWLTSPDLKYLCVVGPRRYTDYGKEACEKLIEGLAGLPIVIVSGLAYGIDSIAHKTALRVGLKTIAIPGSGLDPKVLYPKNHAQLAEEILDAGGALLSEFEPDFVATPWSFPVRNRIMAGISHATLVIEAALGSGTLITAKAALDYNRDVLVVPGSIFSLYSVGALSYLDQGAHPVTKSADIIRMLGLEKVAEDMKTKETLALIADLSADEKTVFDLLETPLLFDELLSKSGLSTSRLNIVISMLEMKDIIVLKNQLINRRLG